MPHSFLFRVSLRLDENERKAKAEYTLLYIHIWQASRSRLGSESLDIIQQPNERTSYGVCQIDRHGVPNLFVFGTERAGKIPLIRKCLYAGIFTDGQRACLRRMATFRLLLSRRTSQCQAWFVKRQTACHACFPSFQLKASTHVFLLDFNGQITPIASHWYMIR